MMPKEKTDREKKLAALAKDSKEIDFEKIDALEEKFGLDHDTQKQLEENEKEDSGLLKTVENLTDIPGVPPHADEE